MGDDNVQVHLIIKGRVQGVFYRASAQEQAQSLGLTGWVRNLPDGSVEAVAEGPAATVDRFVKWCHEGPRHARVDGVETERNPASAQFSGFDVRH